MFRQASLVIAGLLCLVAAPLLADEADEAFNFLYGNEYKRVTATPDKADDVALAKQLFDAAKARGVQPRLMSVLCDSAFQVVYALQVVTAAHRGQDSDCGEGYHVLECTEADGEGRRLNVNWGISGRARKVRDAANN
jgi:hypothetical protein